MPLQSKKLELGVFSEEDEKRMWQTFRGVWENEPYKCGSGKKHKN